MLHEFLRSRPLHDRATHAAREVHALTLDVGAGLLPDLDRLGVVAKIDADLLEDGIGVALEQLKSFLAEHLPIWDLARDVGHRGGGACSTGGALRIASARTPGMGSGQRGRLWLVHIALRKQQYGQVTGLWLINLRHRLVMTRHRPGSLKANPGARGAPLDDRRYGRESRMHSTANPRPAPRECCHGQSARAGRAR